MSDATASTGKAPSPGVVGLLSDHRLARRAAAGDQRAFAAIYSRYHQGLYRYCRAILRDSQEAQDALQNTMVKVLSSLPGEEREIRLKPWLYRIAHNESVELMRRSRPAAELDPETTDPGPQPDDSAEARGQLAGLLEDLRDLPERQRGALAMRELSGLSFDQIAEALATSPAAVRQTVYEARTALQAMSEGREMDCEAVRRALSDGDGRVLRKRGIRAHLRACEGCSDFKAGIAERRREFAAIGPLPAVAAAGLLNSLLGGGGGGGGLAALLGGGAGGAGAVSAGLKSTAAVVAVSAVGIGAAAGGGAIDVGPLGGGGKSESSAPAGAQGAQSSDPHGSSTASKPAATAGEGRGEESGNAAVERRENGGDEESGSAAKPSDASRASDRAEHGQRTAAEAGTRRGQPQNPPPAASHGQQNADSRGGGQPTGESESSAPPSPAPAPPAKPTPPPESQSFPTPPSLAQPQGAKRKATEPPETPSAAEARGEP